MNISKQPQLEQSSCGFLLEKIMKSNDVKRELCEALMKIPRFQSLVKQVVEMLKNGHAPVVIESWNTYCQRNAKSDDFWSKMLPDYAYAKFCAYNDSPTKIELRPSLCGQLPMRAEVRLTLHIHTSKTHIMCEPFCAPQEMLTQLIFWGHRDENYIRLLFAYLGYNVSKGNLSEKFGLLINFG